ncbi:E3 ubiquitin-protein ligase MARCHF2-like [Cotesia glomerata]|uniref:E3 ubiquitin-protein ligase MARCHF2-like n=1 Tax=Cotesia glomerata TaxID=32391 RepID=UPI001D02C294|nr:E3 ubiquitin-protein ligase MARCHF2-like [Cotesia glomerata]
MLSSQQSLDVNTCRICHDDESLEQLVEPCECSGTVALMHISCLEKWLTTSNTRSCEICKYRFPLQTLNKPVMVSLKQWLKIKSNSRGLIVDSICVLVLTFLFMSGMYLCYIGIVYFTQLKTWESTIILTLSIILILIYCIWLAVTIRFHLHSWRLWHKKNKDIKLLIKNGSDSDRTHVIHSNSIQRPLNRNDESNSEIINDNNNTNMDSNLNDVNTSNGFRMWYNRLLNNHQNLQQPVRESLV